MFEFVAAAAIVSGVLVGVEKHWGTDYLIRAAITLAILCSAVNLWQGYPFAETAPIGLTLMVVVPIFLAAGVVHLMRRGPWLLRWLYAMLAAFIGVFPAYMLGCIVSDWLPVPGCFF